MTYYISRNGQQYGPYSLADLQNMLAQGQVLATDQAWGEGMASWAPLSQVLAGASGAPPQQQGRGSTVFEQQPAQPQRPATAYEPQPAQQQAYQDPYAAQVGYGAQAGYPSTRPPQTTPGPTPPNLHWIVVLFISWIWIFVETNFVKKIDRSSKAVWFVLLGIAANITGSVLFYVKVLKQVLDVYGAPDATNAEVWGREVMRLIVEWSIPIYCCWLGGAILMLIGIFSMRSSIQRYYNSVEPIGLRLSGVMTFFFNVLYFQYHFSRIARWKNTGYLT